MIDVSKNGRRWHHLHSLARSSAHSLTISSETAARHEVHTTRRRAKRAAGYVRRRQHGGVGDDRDWGKDLVFHNVLLS